MKALVCLLAVLVLSIQCSVLSAQPLYTPPSFPVGALAFGITNNTDILNDKLPEYGIGAIYDGNPRGADIRPLLLGLDNSLTFYPSRRAELEGYLGAVGGAMLATETRYFLTSKEGDIDHPAELAIDVEKNWSSKAGNITAGREYLITATDVAIGDYYLTDLETADDRLNNEAGYVVDPLQSKVLLDFIFRIDMDLIYNGQSLSDPIYQLEYELIDQSNNHAFSYKDLTVGDYVNYVSSSSTIAHKVNEHPDILVLPRNGSQYAVLRNEITSLTNVKSLKVSLKKKFVGGVNQSKGIFVRGLRIRSEKADQILRKQKDNDFIGTNGIFQSIYNDLKGPGGSQSAWRRTPAIASAPEMPSPGHRALAYIADLWSKWTKQHTGSEKQLYTILAHPGLGTYRSYASTFWDQTGKPCPPLMAQNPINYYWGSGDGNDPQLIIPGDVIPSSAKNHTTNSVRDFEPFNMLISGAVTSGGQITSFGETSFSEYLDYTARFQKKSLTENIHAAEAAYPASKPEAWSKFYGYPATNLGANFRIQSSEHPNYPSSKDITNAGSQMLRAAQLSTTSPNPGLVGVEFEFDDVLSPENVWIKHQTPASSEIRQQTWDALMYGAKGIFFNTIGHDCGENGGFAGLELNDDLITDLTTDYSYFCWVHWYPASPAIKPMPTASSSKALYYPDHFVKNTVNGTIYTCVPIFSDVKVYGEQAKTTLKIDLGQEITSALIDDYIKGMINGWVDFGTLTSGEQASLVEYYDTDNDPWSPDGRVSGWQPFEEDPDGTGPNNPIWCAWDRTIETNPSIGAGFFSSAHYPGSGYISVKLKHSGIYLGMPDRTLGVKTAVADLTPLKEILSKLKWRSSYTISSRSKSDVPTDVKQRADNAHALSPIEIVESKKLSRGWGATPAARSVRSSTDNFGGLDASPTKDANEADLEYGIGLFSDPEDDEAEFVMVVNKRTWPMLKNTDGTATQIDNSTGSNIPLLGAIDARRLQFKVTRSKVDPNSVYDFYTLTNLRTNESVTKKFAENFVHEIDFEPGEGTLFKITPTRSFIVGKASEGGMEYNNGHRVAVLGSISDDEVPPHTWTQRIMTWEREGKIQYGITNNLGEPNEENVFNPASPVPAPSSSTSTTLDNTGRAQNPSICAKISSSEQDTVAVVWSRRNGTNTLRQILLKIGVRTSSRTPSSIVWDNDILLGAEPYDDEDLPTPVVTPLRDGFFVAWAGYDPLDGITQAIRSTLVRRRYPGSGATWDTVTNMVLRANPGTEKVLFPTVTTRDEYSTSSEERRKDRVHLAWEEWTELTPKVKSHIYYAWFDVKYPSAAGPHASDDIVIEPQETDGSDYERVSKGHKACEHHHPNIAVRNPYINGATVLSGTPVVTWEAVTCQAGDQAVVALRSRSDTWGWGSFTEFYKKLKHKTPQPQVRVGVTGIGVPATPETMAVVFHDANTKEIVHERLPFQLKPKWIRSKFYDAGLNPTVSIPFHPNISQSNVTTVAFRGALSDDAGLYSARITARTTGFSKDQPTNLAHSIKISKPSVCDKGVAFFAGVGTIGCDTCPDYTGDTSVTNARTPIQWETKDLGRDGFGDGDPRSGSASVAYEGGSTYSFPRTEDSLITNMFSVSTGDLLRYDRSAMITDTAWFASQFTDTNQFIRVDVLLKDSASHAVVDTIDFMRISKDPSSLPPSIKVIGNITEVKQVLCPDYISTGVLKFGLPPGPPTSVNVPPSGKGYLTIKVTKDTISDFELNHSQIMHEGFDEILDEVEGSEEPAFKTTTLSRASAQRDVLDLLVYPNPFSSISEIELKAVAEAPTSIEMLDVSGRSVMTLFEGLAPSTGLITLKLDRAGIADGTYFLRAVSGGAVGSKRIVIMK